MACNLLDWIRLVWQQTGFYRPARIRINYLGWGITRGHLNKQVFQRKIEISIVAGYS